MTVSGRDQYPATWDWYLTSSDIIYSANSHNTQGSVQEWQCTRTSLSLPHPYPCHNPATMANIKLSIGTAVLAAISFEGHVCSSFQLTPAQRAGSVRFVSSPLPSSMSEESTTENAALDPEAVRLKDNLVALAAGTRRGVSRLFIVLFQHT